MRNAYSDYNPDGKSEGLKVTAPALGLTGALLLYIVLDTRADTRGLCPLLLALSALSAMVFAA